MSKTVTVKCRHCTGKGTKDGKVCPYCQGTGVLKITIDQPVE